MHVREEYDGNVSGGNQLFSSLRGVESSDETTTVGTSLGVHFPFGRGGLSLKASANINRYSRNSQLNSTNADVRAGLTQSFAFCSGDVEGAYSQSLTPGEQLVVAVAKNIATERSVNVGVTCSRRHLQVSTQGHYNWSSNSASGSGITDHHIWGVNGTLGYTDPNLGSLSFLGGYSEVSYPSTVNEAPTTISGYKSTDFGVQYSRSLGMRLSGNANFTYNTTENNAHVQPFSGRVGRNSYSGFSADVGMAYKLSRKAKLNLIYVRGVTPATQLDTGFNVSDSFNFGGSYTLGRRIDLSASASQVRTNYGGVPIGAATLQSDRVRSFSASASVKIGRHLRLSVDGQHQNREANLPIFTYASDRIGISLAGDL
jgi:hypothetical protein